MSAANDSSEGNDASDVSSDFCVEDGDFLEIVFFAIKVTFVGYQFMTDFGSQNDSVCVWGGYVWLCMCLYVS